MDDMRSASSWDPCPDLLLDYLEDKEGRTSSTSSTQYICHMPWEVPQAIGQLDGATKHVEEQDLLETNIATVFCICSWITYEIYRDSFNPISLNVKAVLPDSLGVHFFAAELFLFLGQFQQNFQESFLFEDFEEEEQIPCKQEVVDPWAIAYVVTSAHRPSALLTEPVGV